tara:strand:+ start:109 stop:1107 length:999 start_codon:yes stop_codon:yes gene_type:complete
MRFTEIDKNKFFSQIEKLKSVQAEFLKKYNVNDILSNSKIFEILIANELSHILIPGHSGSRDAKDNEDNVYEYKHFKETSSNHSWTFNDFSDTTIKKLINTKSIIFAHIDDTLSISNKFIFDWYYEVSGKTMSIYLTEKVKNIKNTRKMINVGPNQIEKNLNIFKTYLKNENINGSYYKDLEKIYDIIKELENISNVKNILTSNKIWEVITSVHLNHNVNSEQGGRKGSHDAYDKTGNQYEYKISKTKSWNFQDISENVLNKYQNIKYFILAVKDPLNISVKKIFLVNKGLIERIREKLNKKISKKGSLRRLQVSASFSDIKKFTVKEMEIN